MSRRSSLGAKLPARRSRDRAAPWLSQFPFWNCRLTSCSTDLVIRLLSRWWWVAVSLLFLSCVALKLNGSSIGCWQNALREPAPIRGLLFSTPKKIRSDEWVIWTPSILSQARQTPPFPIENPNLGAGRTPLLMSVPVAYYTTFFRPQLWGFFFLDLERGFSFYWCAKVFGLLLASGWLLHQLGIKNRAIIAFGVVWVFFSSFVQWWFSSPAMLPEMVASWAICLGCVVAFFHETNRRRLTFALLGFIFFGINFVLCLYLPFQIPLLFLAVAVLAGLGLERRQSEQPFRTRRGLMFLAACGAIIGLALIPFWIDAWSTLQIVAQTEYPGGRHNTGGNYAVWQLFGGPIGFFESEDKIPPDFPNICEASNFYPFWPLALIGVWAGKVRARVSISPLLVMLALFLIGLSLYCVVRLPEWLLQATLLSQVHEARALLSIGLANILLVCLFLDRSQKPIFGKYWASGGVLAAGLGIFALFFAIHTRNPGFFADQTRFGLLIAINAVLITMFFWDRARLWLPAVFALLLVCSNGLINPVMRGLGPLTESAAFQEVDKIRATEPQAKWIAWGDYVTGQLVKATGAPVLNGTKIVPDLPFLRQLDTRRAYETVYNRFAWIICAVRVFPEEVSFSLVQAEFYTMHLPPGLPILREAGYDYYIFPGNWRDASLYDFSLVAKTPTNSRCIYRRDEADLAP